ncbi:MAG: hypothetical protein HDR24_13900 [Lachnospiraceae bacterium]|nr:hypothetical protein [Lachnospiraceae bacterium]
MWIRTVTGKNMPVNPKIINYRKPLEEEKATDRVVTTKGEVVAAIPIYNNLNLSDGYGYISHFATCKKITTCKRKHR